MYVKGTVFPEYIVFFRISYCLRKVHYRILHTILQNKASVSSKILPISLLYIMCVIWIYVIM